MKKIIYIFIVALLGVTYAEEFQISATNVLKYGTGTEWAGDAKDIEVKKQYVQDWITIDASRGDFSMGFVYETADPSENNEALNEITKKYFSYSNNDITVTAGDFYATFGRGVVLDMKEEKADFFDSKVTGGKFLYEGDFLKFQALGGKSYFKYINDDDTANKTVDQMDNRILGGETVFNLSEIFKFDDYVLDIGCSYLYMEGEGVPATQFLYESSFIEKTEIGGFYVNLSAFDLDFYNEYAIKTTQRTPSKQGWANYSSLAYTTEGFGITLEFKDYYQYAANPNATSSGFTPYQAGPELNIEHSSHLLNSHPHEVNPNDEIGYKVSILANPMENLDISTIFAIASKHNEDAIMPEFSDDYLPYIDFWADAKYAFGHYNFKLGGGYLKDAPLSKDQNQIVIPGLEGEEDKVEVHLRITALAEMHYEINENSGFMLAGEFQKVSETSPSKDKDFNDIYAAVEYSYPEYGYVNISLITTSEEVEGESPDSWLGFEAGLNIYENHKLELFYGREKTGIKCSGGSCRQVPEFDGFRMTLISEF